MKTKMKERLFLFINSIFFTGIYLYTGDKLFIVIIFAFFFIFFIYRFNIQEDTGDSQIDISKNLSQLFYIIVSAAAFAISILVYFLAK